VTLNVGIMANLVTRCSYRAHLRRRADPQPEGRAAEHLRRRRCCRSSPTPISP
jgi:hypothetical protein